MLKQILKHTIAKVLEWEARLVLRKHKPRVVGVTGNVGKTSTKEAVALVLGSKFDVRKSEKSYNSELGVPLTILGAKSAWMSVWGWFKILVKGLSLSILPNDYPEWLVLEIGADRPGDIKKLVKWIKFDAAVMTRLPDIPVHIEFFKSKEEVAEEKCALARSVSAGGFVIVNIDDESLKRLIPELGAQVITYGLSEGAAVRAENVAIAYEEVEGSKMAAGIAFNVSYGGETHEIKLRDVLGAHHAYPVLAAIAVGLGQGMSLQEAVTAGEKYMTPPGRLHLIAGVKNTLILDDTYNASPVAVEEGLKALASIEASGRKIAVLGDMLELGSYTVEAHKKVGELASKVCDVIVTVGMRAKFIAETARDNKFNEKKMAHFDDAASAGQHLKKMIKSGDIIFAKGSQSIRLEKVVEAIMAHPEDKEKLLVRQEQEWKRR